MENTLPKERIAPAPVQYAVADLPRIEPGVSLNFSVAKVIAILTVVIGHFFPGGLLRIPVTYGLFVFAFSSAYFTARIYGEQVDRPKFWRKKLERLGLRFWVILAFLSVITVLQGKTILHWHSLVHFVGMSGVLNWIGVRSESGLGNGLWFFTLLLLFYVAYPFMVRVARATTVCVIVALAATVAAVWLEEHIRVGHELWITALGFILGVMFGTHQPRVPAWLAAALALCAAAAMLALNLLVGYKGANTALIALAGIGISVWLARVQLAPSRLLTRVARLETYLLEIYLIHVYMFVHPTGHSMVDFPLSLLLIGTAAVTVQHIAAWLASLAFGDRGEEPRRTGPRNVG